MEEGGWRKEGGGRRVEERRVRGRGEREEGGEGGVGWRVEREGGD